MNLKNWIAEFSFAEPNPAIWLAEAQSRRLKNFSQNQIKFLAFNFDMMHLPNTDGSDDYE